MTKTFNIQHNIGRVKYAVNFHDGRKTHADGSPFFDLHTFKNKQKMTGFVRSLKNQGHTGV